MLNNSVSHANKLSQTGNRFRRELMRRSGVFVIGTDTDVGKTYVACQLAELLVDFGMRIGVYKPVASGVENALASDASLLREAAKQTCDLERVCPQQFKLPIAPSAAAAAEGREVDDALLYSGASWWRDHCDLLIVEGVGGGLSPISARLTVLDLAAQLDYPLLLVVADRLGAVNHTLLTLEAAHKRGLQVEAIVLNAMPTERSAMQCANRRLIGDFAPNIDIFNSDDLASLIA